VYRPAFVVEARIPCDDDEGANARKRRYDFLYYAVGEILLRWIPAHVGERQHGDGGLVGAWLVSGGGDCRRAGKAIDADGSIDVLQSLFAEILEGDGELAAHLVAHLGRDANGTGFGQSLQARSDVHAVAIEIAALDDHVAKTDADPQQNLPIF